MAEFKKGDVVCLKSGGPDMTVVDLGNYGPLGPKDGVKCQWFDKATRREEVFESETLKKPDSLGALRAGRI